MELSHMILKDLKSSKFQLVFDYIYKTKKYIIRVPSGFVTDFASIPHIMQVFISPYGKSNSASVIHDWLYSKKCEIKISRAEADLIFLEILKENGVNIIKANVMYYGVRIFGVKHYKN